ncbi:MAG TPA: bifunctional precorrin-2 dehydrogenase/sirohydrochlorin ferrochelatase [Rectinemataceae bacterium]|nr:bifunctional precorrin-2 dehydrogenase/sirohydrochlorin ferrochelatase [Rectinemataceae bacterium]
MNQYPVNLDLRGRKVLVVGGGRVACRKAKDALEAGAEITVVSPAVDAEMAALRDAGSLRLVSRRFEAADLEGCFLAIAATDDTAVNAEVSRAALREDILVNVVDDAALSNFTVPAKLRRGALLLTASTGGASPSLSREIRRKLEGIFGEEYAAYLEFMEKLRPFVIEKTGDQRERAAIFGALADFGLIDLFAKDRLRFLESLRDRLPAGLMKRAEEILPLARDGRMGPTEG